MSHQMEFPKSQKYGFKKNCRSQTSESRKPTSVDQCPKLRLIQLNQLTLFYVVYVYPSQLSSFLTTCSSTQIFFLIK